jgi:hypothetical protein
MLPKSGSSMIGEAAKIGRFQGFLGPFAKADQKLDLNYVKNIIFIAADTMS